MVSNKLRAFLAGFLLIFAFQAHSVHADFVGNPSLQFGGGGFVPTDLEHAFLGGTKTVEKWENAKGYWPDLEQTLPASQPTYDAGGDFYTFNGVDQFMAVPSAANDATNLVSQPVPDASGGDPDEGYTITGLRLIPAGLLGASEPEEWLTGNDGRGAPADPTNEASLVILNKTGDSIRREFTQGVELPSFGTSVSIQGTAVNTLTGTGYYVTTEATRKVREINLTTGAEISNFDVNNNANGIAFNENTNEIYVLETDGDVAIYNTSGVFQGNLPTSMSGSGIDMLYYDPENNVLWYSYGNNGSNGNIRPYSISRDVLGSVVTLAGATAIEGIHIQGKKLWVANDRYFHNGTPAGNTLDNYDYNPASQNARLRGIYTQFQYDFIIDALSSTSDTEVIAGVADAVNEAGFTIYKKSNTFDEIRVIVNDGVSLEAIDLTLGTPLSTQSHITLRIDFPTKSISMWQNGVFQDIQLYTLNVTSIIYIEQSIADNYDSADSRELNAEYYALAIADFFRTDADTNLLGNYWADLYGLTWTDL